MEIKKESDINIPKQGPLERLKTYARLNGFELLTTEWTGILGLYQFKHIESGELYEGRPKNIKNRGFPKNLNKGGPKTDLTDIKKLKRLANYAEQNGFELLDTKWRGAAAKYKFKHTLSANEYEFGAYVQQRGFPQELDSDNNRYNKLLNYASDNGFQLLETKWLGVDVKHRFKHIDTNETYEWTPLQVMHKDRGFPLINGQRYVTEEVCRQAMSHIFGGEFKSDRYYLKELHGKNIQLDGLEEFKETPDILSVSNRRKLIMNDIERDVNFEITKIVFEFQGHRGHFDDERVMQNDKLRIKYCQQLGILLIVINPPKDWKKIRDSNYMFEHVCSAIEDAINIGEPLQFKQNFKINLDTWLPDRDAFNRLQQYS